MLWIFIRCVIRRWWATPLVWLMLAGMVLVPGVAAQGGQGPRLAVITPAINLRAGPGVSYSVVGVLTQGDEVPVIGRHSPNGWWQVQLPDGHTGWVSGRPVYVRISGDTSHVPEGMASPESKGSWASAAVTRARGTIVLQTVSGGPIYAIDVDTLAGTPARVAEPPVRACAGPRLPPHLCLRHRCRQVRAGRAGGTNLRYLTTGMDPALSPDGQWVAFTRWEGPQHGAPGSLWVININTLTGTGSTGEHMILGDIRQPKAPVWSPDGTQIAISMQQGGRLQPEHKCSHSLPSEPLLADEDGDYIRVVVEVDGDDVEVKYCYTLLPHPFWGLRMVGVATGAFRDLPHDLFSYAPTWDPANDWHLVYDGEMGLVNLDLNQGTTWPLTDDVNDHTPVFSPDGSKIAVSYWQHDHWEIHILNAGGSGRVRLTKTPLRVIVEQRIEGEEGRAWNNAAPAWSPDGNEIAFVTDRSGRWEVWVMYTDGSGQRPLFPEGVQAQLNLQYNGVDERMLSWVE